LFMRMSGRAERFHAARRVFA